MCNATGPRAPRQAPAVGGVGKSCAKLFQQSTTVTHGASVMDRTEFLQTTQQLIAAAEILATAGPKDSRSGASQMLEFFRRYDRPGPESSAVATSDDDLFARTGQAALTMAGRNEFAASHALLEQARSLLTAT